GGHDAARAAASAAMPNGAGRARQTGPASASAAHADDLDPARPGRRGPAPRGGQHRRFAARRALTEPGAARAAVDPQRLMPGVAVGADLQPKVVIADQPQLGPPAPAA